MLQRLINELDRFNAFTSNKPMLCRVNDRGIIFVKQDKKRTKFFELATLVKFPPNKEFILAKNEILKLINFSSDLKINGDKYMIDPSENMELTIYEVARREEEIYPRPRIHYKVNFFTIKNPVYLFFLKLFNSTYRIGFKELK